MMDATLAALSKDSAECTDEPLPDTLSPEEVEAMNADRARRARNDLRAKLWTDPGFAHLWLCHGGRDPEEVGEVCAWPFDLPAGCGHNPEPARQAFYDSPMEGPADG